MSISNLDTSKVYKIDEPIVLNNVYFETAKYDLLPESNTELDNLVILLKENISYKIEIDGHTDNTGNEKDNQVLSENRAKAVVDYILNKGISKDRLSYKGYGSSKPIADNNIDEGKAKNRRVEFKIVSK
jgi:outer membrane protein OmpA-like peptidoglycan-associated protein